MNEASDSYRLGRLVFARRELRQAGTGLALALAVLSLPAFFTGRMARFETLAAASALVLGLAMLWPAAMIPLHLAAGILLQTLAWVSTRVMLALVFYLVFAPAGLMLRVLGIDLLDREIEPERESYWQERPREPFDKSRLEKQF